MNYQLKIDNMIQILENYKYRVKVISELDWEDFFYSFDIYSERQPWLSERFNILYKNRNGKFYFYINLNLHDIDLTKRDTILMMDFWKEAVELCEHLNNLKIPYIEEYEGENGLINCFKLAYKKFNKRLLLYKI